MTAPVSGRWLAAVAAVVTLISLLGVGATTIAVIGLPWLAVKYVPVAAVLGLALLVGTGRRPRLVFGILGVRAAGALYLWVHQIVYGGWTVYASGDHFESTGEFSVVGTDVDVLGRSRRPHRTSRRSTVRGRSMVADLVPRAIVRCRRRSGRPDVQRRHSTGIGGRCMCGCAWRSSAWAGSTRPMSPSRCTAGGSRAVNWSWSCQLPPSWWRQWAAPGRRRLVATGLLSVVGASNWLWLAVESTIGRRTLVIDFAETTAPFYRMLSPLFPDGITGGGANDLGLLAWTVAVIGGALWAGGQSGRTPRRSLDTADHP